MDEISRRSAIGMIAAGTLAAGQTDFPASAAKPDAAKSKKPPRLRQALTRMALGDDRPVEDCCRVAASLGCSGLDFFSDPKEWPILGKYGLVCSMYRADFGGGSSRGGRPPQGPLGWHAIGMKQAQNEYLSAIHEAIDIAGNHGVPNIILLAGTRHAVSYEEGANNAVDFCILVKEHAEKRGVTLCMELINSTGFGGPPLSLFDHAEWGLDVCRRVNSPRVKILYDVFHGQIMDGNIAETIRKNIGLIGHIHVGGVPGRHEIDASQELNYGFLAQVIADSGYTGFIGHEWTPSAGGDPLKKIAKSVKIIDRHSAADRL